MKTPSRDTKWPVCDCSIFTYSFYRDNHAICNVIIQILIKNKSVYSLERTQNIINYNLFKETIIRCIKNGHSFALNFTIYNDKSFKI